MLAITTDRHIVIGASTVTPGPRSKPRALVADPIEVATSNGRRTWRPCSRKHREYIEAGLLPISCTRCESEVA